MIATLVLKKGVLAQMISVCHTMFKFKPTKSSNLIDMEKILRHTHNIENNDPFLPFLLIL
jgi:hypothetical protein